MPYSGPNDSKLPDAVKKLPGEKRRQWVAIFNRVLSSGKSEQEAFKAAGTVFGKQAMEDDELSMSEYWFRDFDKKQRDQAAASGAAMPDGSFPIKSEQDLKNAIHALGRANNPDAVKRHIIKRAKALGKTDLLPADWSGSTKEAMEGPDTGDVHVDAPVTTKKKGKNSHFMTRMMSLLSAKYTDQEIGDLVKKARAHAGGMTAADIKRMKATLGDQYSGPDAAPENNLTKSKKTDKAMAEDESLTQRVNEVTSAFRAQFGSDYSVQPPTPASYYCREVWDTYVIAEDAQTGDLCKMTYEEDDSGNISFGSPVPVQIRYEEVAMSESDVADMCAAGHDWALFVECDFAEPPEWMPLLPKPGQYQHPEYGEIKITKGRNQSFVNNFNKGVYQSSLPINTEHAADTSGAYGWIEELRMNENGSVDARVKWSDRGTDAIRNDRFRYISPEWSDTWTDASGKTFKDVLRGAALTVRPYFKDKFLRPLVANEAGLFASTVGRKLPAPSDTIEIFYFTALAPSAPAASLDQSQQGESDMADQEKDKTPEPEPTPTPDKVPDTGKLGTEASPSAKEFAEMKDQLKTLTEDNAKLKAEARAKRFREEIKGQTEGGVKWFGDHAKHLGILESLAKTFGEDSNEFTTYVEIQRATAKQMATSDLFKEMGAEGDSTAGGNATEQLNAMITERVKKSDGKLTYADASRQVFEENPQLYNEHAKAHTVRV